MNRGTFLFTVDEYHRMIDHGILTPEDRVELIRGRIVPKNGVIRKIGDGEQTSWKHETFHFTVDEYHRMIETGVLTENDRVELIRGEIVPKLTIGDRHADSVRRLNRILSSEVGRLAIVDIQNPVVLADSEPEPDAMLLRLPLDAYRNRKPLPVDVLLIIEVSDSSIEMDRNVKMPLYSANGITEYWIVNLDDDCLEVYRNPEPTGYREKRILKGSDQVEVAALPGTVIQVSDLL